MRKVLFIDRDGTIIKEAPPNYRVDAFSKLEFYPAVFKYLGKIAEELDYELVLVTNQDGLGTPEFPEEVFWPVHQHIVRSFENEGIFFSGTYIDRSYPHDHSPDRKPGTGMISHYLNNTDYDIAASFVIGDRITDVQFAKNIGCRAIWLKQMPELGSNELVNTIDELNDVIALETQEWCDIYYFLKLNQEDEV